MTLANGEISDVLLWLPAITLFILWLTMKSSVISEVVEASFSIYLDNDRKDVLSACQVTSLESLTAEEVPVPG